MRRRWWMGTGRSSFSTCPGARQSFDEGRLLEALDETPAEAVHKEQDHRVVLPGGKLLADPRGDPREPARVVARFDEMIPQIISSSAIIIFAGAPPDLHREVRAAIPRVDLAHRGKVQPVHGRFESRGYFWSDSTVARAGHNSS